MKSFLVGSTICLSLLIPAVGFSYDSLNLSCDVPVCSISDTMTQLRGMTGDQRGMFALNLKNQYKDSTDQKVLANLRESGLQMKALFQELGDEDWVQRAAADLVAGAVYNLAKLSHDGAELVSYYKELSNQTFRFNLITHWQSQLKTIEDLELLQQLIIFADGARAHSIAINDEDWVPRQASTLMSELTIKLTQLDPVHEGLYSVEVHGNNKSIDALAFDRIAVLDSSSSKNLVVAFINSRLRVIVHTFSQAEIMGNTVKGISMPSGAPATRFSFELDRRTGMISGSVESTNDTMDFTGTQLESTRTVFAGKAPHEVSQKDIIGTMIGEMGGVKGKLTIRSFQENVYSATFVSDTGSIVLNFQGKFFPKNAVLSLTSNEKVKLTMSLREAGWSGFSFSTTTGTSSKATFSTVK